MYEDNDGMDINLDLDLDLTSTTESETEQTYSEQELRDALGIEEVVESGRIAGLEEVSESASVERLRKVKAANRKREQAKRKAELEAKKAAESRRVAENNRVSNETVSRTSNTYSQNSTNSTFYTQGNPNRSESTASHSEVAQERSSFSSTDTLKRNSAEESIRIESSKFARPSSFTEVDSDIGNSSSIENITYTGPSLYAEKSGNGETSYESTESESSYRGESSYRNEPVYRSGPASRGDQSLRSGQDYSNTSDSVSNTVSGPNMDSTPNTTSTPNTASVLTTTSRSTDTSSGFAGTMTEAGVFVGCDVLPPFEVVGQQAFNSRKEQSVIQPETRPAEDASKITATVQYSADSDTPVISRRTADYSGTEDTTYLKTKNLRDVSPEEMVESVPRKVDTSILYAHSADMDSKAERVVSFRSSEKPSVVVGDTPDSDFKAKEAEGQSMFATDKRASGQDASLSGQKEKEPDADKEGTVSKETKEGEEAEYRTIQEASKRKFARENGQMWKDVCQSSRIVISAVASSLSPDDDAGYQAYKKGTHAIASVNNFLSYWGASATYNMISDRAMDVEKTASLVESLISGTGTTASTAVSASRTIAEHLNLTDLSLSGRELRSKLEAMEGLTEKQIGRILSNREEVKQMLEAKQLLLDFSTKTGRLSEEALDFIRSSDFFNHALFSQEFSSAVASYFSASSDELLRSVNPASMTSKEIARLLKLDEKNKSKGLAGFSEADVSFLKLVQKQKKTSSILSKNRHAHGVVNKMSGFLKFAKNMVSRLDDATVDGLRQMFKIYDGGRTAATMFKLGGRMTSWTAKRVGRAVFLNPASRYAGRKIAQGARVIKNTASTAVKASAPAKALSKGKDAIKNSLGKSKQVKALKTKAAKIKQVKNSVGNKVKTFNKNRKNVTRKIKKGSKKVGKVLRAPVKLVFKPFTAISKLFSKVTEFVMKKIMLPIAGVLAVLLLVYGLLSAISAVLIVLVDNSQKVIMLEADEIQLLVDNLNDKTADVYADAKDIAKDSPISDKVYGNTKLYAYGSPKYHGDPTSEYYHSKTTVDESLLNGWHVYYLDSQGNVLGSNVSNVKDIISVACAMMHNASDDVGEYEHLVNDMWDGMVPVITARESDIYHTEYSTDKFPKDGSTYYCTDEDFYEEYDAVYVEGVCFYDTVEPRHLTDADDAGYICTGKGCQYNEWDEWVSLCTLPEHTHGTDCDESHCSHSCKTEGCTVHQRYADGCVDSCAHKSSVQSEYYDCEHECDEDCCSKSEHEHLKSETDPNSCYRHDYHRDYYCPGHSALHCSYGYRDINVYVTLILKEDVYKSAIDSGKCVIDYKVPNNFNCTTFEDRQSTIKFQNHWNGYKKRMKDFFNNGAWDYAQHSAHAVLNPDTGYLECDVPRVSNGNFKTGAAKTDRCVGTIEWCNNLFNTDWVEYYGVSVYSSDSGLAVGGSLTQDERQAIVASIAGQYGDIGTARQSFVDFALDYVGAIQYWYGGKPSSKSWDSTWGTVAPSSNPYYSYNTRKGRNVLGLDCSGFVGWCYWNAFNTQPGCSTANFTTSLGLSQTSFMNLRPGDIGLTSIPGSSSNHIGIFVGFDENGKALWVHCNGSTGNVAINNYNGFRYYYSLIP